MSLEEWQGRLAVHFRDLHNRRVALPGNRPIFGLEHELTEPEFQSLENEIVNHICKSPPANEHSLVWVVYASEIGYRFSGDEYWQTFAQRTQGWNRFGSRDWLRTCFLSFHQKYGGAYPSGRWAEHFTIICWPITNAILPQDLQRELAQVLYEIRHEFTSEIFQSPGKLGEQIAVHSLNAKSRFQNFCEENLLVGQIATALLFQGEDLADSLIAPSTLKRIVRDLDRERRSRDWLRVAQQAARQVQLRGLSRALGEDERSKIFSIARARKQVADLAIEPRIILRPAASSSWNIWIEIPDLGHLLSRFPDLKDTLTNSRCAVNGSSGKPLARGAFLRGPRKVLFYSWPPTDQVLLQFENSTQQLDFLLRTECLLRPGPIWVFKIASDGLAYELRGKTVRPDSSYILLSKKLSFPNHPCIAQVNVDCLEIQAARLDVPATFTPDILNCLKELGLNELRTLAVWPAGLSAANWDGEGRGEWLSTDQPRIGIHADYPIASFTFTLDGSESERQDIPPGESDTTTYIELPSLAVGNYDLEIIAISRDDEEAAGQLEVVVRNPQAWKRGLNSQGALQVFVDPISPVLEQLWSGVVAIGIQGPVGFQVEITVSLFKKGSTTPLRVKHLPPVLLPFSSEKWGAYFEKSFQSHQDVRNMYDLAYTCMINIDAQEFGQHHLVFEREFVPLRWALQNSGQSHTLILFDDSGAADVKVYCYGFGKPELAIPVNVEAFKQPYTVPSSGGMYLASAASNHHGIIIPPQFSPSDLLRISPEIQASVRSVQTIKELLGVIALWANARVTGNLLSSLRRRDVLIALFRRIFRLVSGDKWERAELSFDSQSDGDSIEIIKAAIASSAPERGLAAVLASDLPSLVSAPVSQRLFRFSAIISRFSVIPSLSGLQHFEIDRLINKVQWICEFALRLASYPESVHDWAGQDLEIGIEVLLKAPLLARSARFLVLGIDRHLGPAPLHLNRIYPGWEWN